MTHYRETLARIENYNGDENHYLLIWDDPMVMEIRNEKQLRSMFEACKEYEEENGDWLLCGERRSYDESICKDIDEIMAHLNKEKEVSIGEMRDPSPQSVTDENGYVRIRRIYNNGE
jgi:hypothetical protein